MEAKLTRYLLIVAGWLAVILGLIGAVLPIVPTTPFLIVALACFSKSSPRFHRMLLTNKWFGPPLKEWENNHTVKRHVKIKAMMLIVVSFGISIAILSGRSGLQLMLLGLGSIALWFIYHLKES